MKSLKPKEPLNHRMRPLSFIAWMVKPIWYSSKKGTKFNGLRNNHLQTHRTDQRPYRFSTLLTVRIQDINYGAHLGNDTFIQYFHETRMQYLDRLGFSEKDLGGGLGVILTELHCQFKGEAFYKDTLRVYARICDIKKVRFTMDYQMIREKDQVLIATGYSVQASFDYQTRRPVALPEGFITKVKDYEDGL